MKTLILALVIALAAVAPGALSPETVVAQSVTPIVQAQESALDLDLHEIYVGAVARAIEIADAKPEEILAEKYVHWMMPIEKREMDFDCHLAPWSTDIFRTGTSRVMAWYKSTGYTMVDGIAQPRDSRIEMLITAEEIERNRHYVEGVLTHELLHYTHHYRAMNEKGWVQMWPDSHGWMAFLSYVENHDLPANKY